MVVAWRQVRIVRGGQKSPSWRAWAEHLSKPRCGDRALSCRRTTPLVSILHHFFFFGSLPKLIHRFTINLWRYCGPWCHEFCQKIPLQSQNTYFTAGGSSDDSVHVSSVITPTLRSKNVWGQAFSDKRYLLLLSVRFGAMTTRFFLPTNRRLILELPSYLFCCPLQHALSPRPLS
jgi:hypothetical protein